MKKSEQTLSEMHGASRAVDNQTDPMNYSVMMYTLAVLARQYLRDLAREEEQAKDELCAELGIRRPKTKAEFRAAAVGRPLRAKRRGK